MIGVAPESSVRVLDREEGRAGGGDDGRGVRLHGTFPCAYRPEFDH